MALYIKTLFTQGCGSSARLVAQPMLVHVKHYGRYFTAKPRRQARPKTRWPKKIEPVTEVEPIQLYAQELGERSLQARSADLPVETMENPFTEEKQKCLLCRHNITPDYKNVRLLSQFVSSFSGQTYGRHITRLCKMQQERIEIEIKKSQNAGLMANYLKDPVFLEDPKICDPDRPVRRHPH